MLQFVVLQIGKVVGVRYRNFSNVTVSPTLDDCF